MKIAVIFLSAIAIWGILILDASAQIPSTITYQGFLETGGQPVDGSVAMTVRLYTQAAGGAANWVGTFPTVSVNKGVYTIVLNPAGLVFDKLYYLETEVNGSVTASRTALTSVPYALGPWTPDSSGSGTISYSGKVGIGTGSTPQARLELQGDWNVGMPALRLLGNKPSLEFDGNGQSGNKQWLMHLGANGPGNLEFYDLASNIPAMSLNPVGAAEPRLQLYAQDGLETVGYQPFLTLTDNNAGYAKTKIQNANGDFAFFTQNDLGSGLPALTIRSTGGSRLTVLAQDGLNTVGYEPFLTLTDANAAYARSRIQGFNGDINFFPESFIGGSAAIVVKNTSGNVGIGTSSPAAKLDVVGSLHAAGDATQARDKGGMVKAMAWVKGDGTVYRSWSAYGTTITASALTLGYGYQIHFGFQVDDRFISVTPMATTPRGLVADFAGWNDANTVNVVVRYSDTGDATYDDFFIFVY